MANQSNLARINTEVNCFFYYLIFINRGILSDDEYKNIGNLKACPFLSLFIWFLHSFGMTINYLTCPHSISYDLDSGHPSIDGDQFVDCYFISIEEGQMMACL